MDAIIAKLKARLEENPNDAQGWWMLGRSFRALERQQEAVLALRKAHELLGDNPDLLVQLADTLAVTQGRLLAGEPAELIRKALAIEPGHVVGLWLAGTAAYQAGDEKKALEYWTRLRPLLADDKAALEQLDSAIADVTGRPVPPAPAPAATGSGKGVRVKVSLAEELRGEIRGDQTVFVIARRLEGGGAPIAVARRSAAELPFEVNLDDSLAMTPQARISQLQQVKVSARISKSGNPAAQSGDLFG
jgi:cytochrome c-type biogenesis protein CcmH